MASIEKKLRSIYRKNIDDLSALLTARYPSFVYRALPGGLMSEIPVFVFHEADYHLLDRQLRFLSANAYRTLTADAFFEIITGQRKLDRPSVLLTFDDGRTSVWTTAYPLLKRYGFQAVCFLVPMWIENGDKERMTLEHVWRGKSSLDAIRRQTSLSPLCNWKEIRKMHQTGVIDFQSHSLSHSSVFTDPKIVDFFQPRMTASFLNGSFQPKILTNSSEQTPQRLRLGQPIYPWKPFFSEYRRYLEDPWLSEACIQLVADNGGAAFFTEKNWRHRLKAHVKQFKRTRDHNGRFQSKRDRIADMIKDLSTSKQIIESELDKSVDHLCYPWFTGGPSTVKAARESGYRSSYWGFIYRGKTNPIGTDPYYISRISEDYLMALPGKGRQQLLRLLLNKTKRIKKKHINRYGSQWFPA